MARLRATVCFQKRHFATPDNFVEIVGNFSRRHPVQDVMTSSPSNEIVVYWRPGCPFCFSLLRQLDKRGVPHRRVNIWQDPTAAAAVRSAANGNETVPTVRIGPVTLVNPNVHAVLAAAAEHVPETVPDGYEPPHTGRLGRWLLGRLSGRR